MVEPVMNDDLLRTFTPTPTPKTSENMLILQDIPSPPGQILVGEDFFYASSTSQVLSNSADVNSGAQGASGALNGGGENKNQPISMSDPGKPVGSRGRSHSNPRRRPQLPRQHSLHSPAESAYNVQSTSYQSYSSSPGPYNQRPSFPGPYPVDPQPPMGMPPNTQTFSYQQGFRGLPRLNSQNIHAGYQPMLRPPGPVYQYEGSSSGYAQNASMYTVQPSPMTPPSMPSHSSSGQVVSHSQSYPASGQLQSMSFRSTPPYGYPSPHSFPATTMYQSQLPYAYTQPYSSPDHHADSQGMWLYLPPGTSMQYDNNSGTYQTPYPINHSSPSLQDGESPSYALNVPSPYTLSPIRSPLIYPTGPGSPSPSSAPLLPILSPKPESSLAPRNQDKRPTRRSYHPNPPAHRSEWVMWVGNVPSDATYDELFRFFSKVSLPLPTGEPEKSHILSVFPIFRSSCAFINYDSEDALQNAIQQFNGVALRPDDSRCPKLVCRIRKRDDDLKAGVGGQRGIGIHMKWIQEHKGTDKVASEMSDTYDSAPRTPSSTSDGYSHRVTPSLSASSDDETRPSLRKAGSSNNSGSTSSSILLRHFPQRYFILKSLSQDDLMLSVEKGVWATQKHNEGILDQAFRTSKDVFLIFSVNKSGEFFGYAKMAGPIRQGESKVAWSQRSDSSPSTRSINSTGTRRSSILSNVIPEESPSPSPSLHPTDASFSLPYFPSIDHRMADESPQPLATSSGVKLTTVSAPAEMDRQHRKITAPTPEMKPGTFDESGLLSNMKGRTQAASPFPLDESAPIRAIKHHPDESLQSASEENESAKEDGWGESFRVEWVCTERLPFYRTRHLRNPWNHDREVKVSRDGTELEPFVGQQLIEEWPKMAEESKHSGSHSSTGPQRRAGKEKEKDDR